MRYVAIVLAGLLLAAGVHYAMLPGGQRARILDVAPAPAPAPVASVPPPHADPAAPEIDRTLTAVVTSRGDGMAGTSSSRVGTAPAVRPGGESAGLDASPPAVAPAPLPSGLVVPVEGVAPASLTPTFHDDRGEGRVHEALDIMARAGTPVLAVADGHVEKLFDSDRGGLTIYQFEPSGRYAYYYAHLERYAPGLEEGQALRQGQVIGYVGSSGNANPAAPHLHFAIFRLGPERRWWEGTPVDPWPLLSGGTP